MRYTTCNWFLAGDDLVISQINKNATNSLRRLFCERRAADQIKDFNTRIGLIRHPMDRLESAYSYLTRLSAEPWDVFIDTLLEKNDAHWFPQKPQLTLGQWFVPSIVLKLEDISEWWSEYFPNIKRFPTRNVHEHKKYNHYREEEVLEYYGEDLLMWEAA